MASHHDKSLHPVTATSYCYSADVWKNCFLSGCVRIPPRYLRWRWDLAWTLCERLERTEMKLVWTHRSGYNANRAKACIQPTNCQHRLRRIGSPSEGKGENSVSVRALEDSWTYTYGWTQTKWQKMPLSVISPADYYSNSASVPTESTPFVSLHYCTPLFENESKAPRRTHSLPLCLVFEHSCTKTVQPSLASDKLGDPAQSGRRHCDGHQLCLTSLRWGRENCTSSLFFATFINLVSCENTLSLGTSAHSRKNFNFVLSAVQYFPAATHLLLKEVSFSLFPLRRRLSVAIFALHMIL